MNSTVIMCTASAVQEQQCCNCTNCTKIAQCCRSVVMGCGRPGPGGPGTHKVFEWNLQWAGTHKVLAEKVSGYGNFRWFTYTNVYSCKMLTFWYTWYDGMTYTRMYKYMLAISMCMYTCTVYSRVVQMFPSKEPNFWLRLTHRSQI